MLCVFIVFYRKVTALKKFGVKVLLAIGGWNDSAGSKYSELVNNPSARRNFVRHVVGYLKQNDFDGLDFDWEYPKCWQVRDNEPKIRIFGRLVERYAT